MRILFVDDTRDTCEVFRFSFRLEGHQMDIASNGLKGVEAAQRVNYDAIVLDVSMPLMDGWEAARAIRQLESGQDVPIILFTARNSTLEDNEKAAAMDVDIILRKPIMPEELLSHITHLIAKAKR